MHWVRPPFEWFKGEFVLDLAVDAFAHHAERLLREPLESRAAAYLFGHGSLLDPPTLAKMAHVEDSAYRPKSRDRRSLNIVVSFYCRQGREDDSLFQRFTYSRDISNIRMIEER